MTLISEQIRIFQDANVALAKRRRALKTRVQHGGTLSLEKSKAFIVSKTKGKRPAPIKDENINSLKRAKIISRRCGICGETGHNARTCSKNIESSSESESDES